MKALRKLVNRDRLKKLTRLVLLTLVKIFLFFGLLLELLISFAADESNFSHILLITMLLGLYHFIKEENRNSAKAHSLEKGWKGYFYPFQVELILKYQEKSIRSLNKWKGPERNDKPVLLDLLDYLFVDKYEVASYFRHEVNSFFSEHSLARFIYLAEGKDILGLPHLPYPITRKMGKLLLAYQSKDNFYEALRWVEVRGMGGSEALARAIAKLNYLLEKGDHEFWRSVWVYLSLQKINNMDFVPHLLAYLSAMKFGWEEEDVLNGGYTFHEAEKPHMEVKGRNFNNLIEEAYRWYVKAQRFDLDTFPDWASRVNSFVKEEEKVQFFILPLKTKKDLVDEGNFMQHCVADYAPDCVRGETSIWSLRQRSEEGGSQRLLTIELRPDLTIVQVQGQANSYPGAREMNLLEAWAQGNELKVLLED